MNVDQVGTQELEGEIDSLANGRRPHFFLKKGDDLKVIENGRQKTTSMFLKIRDDPNFLAEWKTM